MKILILLLGILSAHHASGKVRQLRLITLQQEPSHLQPPQEVGVGEKVTVNFVSLSEDRWIDMASTPKAKLYIVPYYLPRVESVNYVQMDTQQLAAKWRRKAAKGEVNMGKFEREYYSTVRLLKKKHSVRFMISYLKRPFMKKVMKTMEEKYGMYRVRSTDIDLKEIRWRRNVRNVQMDGNLYRSEFSITVPKKVQDYCGDVYEFAVRMLGRGAGGTYANYAVSFETFRLKSGLQKGPHPDAVMARKGLATFDREAPFNTSREQIIKANSVLAGRIPNGIMFRISLAGLPSFDYRSADIKSMFEPTYPGKSWGYAYRFYIGLTLGFANIEVSQFEDRNSTYMLCVKYSYVPYEGQNMRYPFWNDIRVPLLRPIELRKYTSQRVNVEVVGDALNLYFIDIPFE